MYSLRVIGVLGLTLPILAACGGGSASESSILAACADNQRYHASNGTDVYNSSFLEGRDPELASEDVIETCCPVYAESAMKPSNPALRELAVLRLRQGTVSGDAQSKVMSRRSAIEDKFDRETLNEFWNRGAMQAFNACRKENFFPRMP